MAKVNLKRGDSAVIIRHKNQGFDIEIYHKVDKKLLTEEELVPVCLRYQVEPTPWHH